MKPEFQSVLEELKAREPIFHRPEWGTTRADFERMTTEDFWEIGASGTRYERSFVLDELERRYKDPHPDVWTARDFECSPLAEGVYLLTYTLVQDEVRVTRRTTIWKRSDDGWKIVFHQGTLIQNG